MQFVANSRRTQLSNLIRTLSRKVERGTARGAAKGRLFADRAFAPHDTVSDAARKQNAWPQIDVAAPKYVNKPYARRYPDEISRRLRPSQRRGPPGPSNLAEGDTTQIRR